MSTLSEAFAATMSPVTETETSEIAPVVLPTDSPEPQFTPENVDVEQPTISTEQPLTQEDEDYLKSFADGIGYTGELPTDKEGLDVFLDIANKQIGQYKETSEFYTSNEVLKDLGEYIKAGGTPQEFFAQEQETNIWESVDIPEDDVLQREELIAHYLTDYKGMDKEEAEILINSYKEKGKFDSEFDKSLNFLKQDEVARNEKIRQDRQVDINSRKEETQKYINDTVKEFESGFTGLSVDANILAKAKTLSLPDAKGVFGIVELANSFNAKQQAMLNIFAAALSENKPFQYNPTIGTINNKPKPISAIVNKAKPASVNTENQSLSSFAQALRNKNSN